MQTASTWWPTFYLQGLGMSVTGDALELDILEVASQGSSSPAVYQSIHLYAPSPTGEIGPDPANNVVSPTYSTDGTSYNTFGLLWTAAGITFDINGKQGPTFSMSTSVPWVGEGGSTFSGNLTGNTLIGSGQYLPIVIGTGNSGPSMTISSVQVWQ
jgi:beta-glucanase (GH16 family)